MSNPYFLPYLRAQYPRTENKSHPAFKMRLTDKIPPFIFFYNEVVAGKHGSRIKEVFHKKFKVKFKTCIEDEAYFIFSCMHHDAPDELFDRLMLDMKKNLETKSNSWEQLVEVQKVQRMIAYAIGDAGQPRQWELLSSVMERLNGEGKAGKSFALNVLGISIWRTGELIWKFKAEELSEICEGLSQFLGEGSMALEKSPSRKVFLKLLYPLELLYGLLRTRESKDDEIRKLLVPGHTLTEKFVHAVEKISEIDARKKFSYESRIKFQDKDESGQTPNLLHALDLYLRGNPDAGSIQVMHVEQSETSTT